jgi:hypothetical protein
MEPGKGEMGNRKGKIERRKWKITNGKGKMENGKWKMENGKWKIKNGKKEKGEWKKGNMRVQELNRINGKGKWNRADGEGLPLNFDKVGEFMLFTKVNYEITKVIVATQHLCSSNICNSSFYWIYNKIRTNIFFSSVGFHNELLH